MPGTMTHTSLLLDLDGTLIDPAPGITASMAYALERLGLPVPSREDLVRHIGPPLHATFREILSQASPGQTVPQPEVDRAVALYRERYGDTGLFEMSAYEGIAQAVQTLAARGVPLYLATSKAGVFARRIVEHLGLASCFVAMHGAELDGTRSDKGELIAHILSSHGLTAKHCVMVGDRKHDIIGAGRHAMPSAGVLWGYGSREELEQAGAGRILVRPSQLTELA